MNSKDARNIIPDFSKSFPDAFNELVTMFGDRLSDRHPEVGERIKIDRFMQIRDGYCVFTIPTNTEGVITEVYHSDTTNKYVVLVEFDIPGPLNTRKFSAYLRYAGRDIIDEQADGSFYMSDADDKHPITALTFIDNWDASELVNSNFEGYWRHVYESANVLGDLDLLEAANEVLNGLDKSE